MGQYLWVLWPTLVVIAWVVTWKIERHLDP